jgi:hypothetical protein
MKILSRYDFSARFDRAMRATVLRYAGRGIAFEETLYGQEPGVILVAIHDELPWPPSVTKVSEETGVPVLSTTGAAELQRAVVDAIVAGAMVEAPQLIKEFSRTPTRWLGSDLADLTRRHVLTLSRVAANARIVETEMKLRVARPVEIVAMAPMAPMAPYMSPRYSLSSPAPEPTKAPVEPALPPSVPAPATSIVARAQEAIAAARTAELPQRLPQGARRALERMVRAVYLIRDSDPVPQVRADLTEAMADAERAARDEKVDVTVIDWDGEWPVVARRYEKGGRTIYRVEDALKRQERAA